MNPLYIYLQLLKVWKIFEDCYFWNSWIYLLQTNDNNVFNKIIECSEYISLIRVVFETSFTFLIFCISWILGRKNIKRNKVQTKKKQNTGCNNNKQTLKILKGIVLKVRNIYMIFIRIKIDECLEHFILQNSTECFLKV